MREVVAAKAATAACAGWHIGVAILDQAGTPKLYYIPDGTAGWHAYTSFRKANTALLIKAPKTGGADDIAAEADRIDDTQARAYRRMAEDQGLSITGLQDRLASCPPRRSTVGQQQ